MGFIQLQKDQDPTSDLQSTLDELHSQAFVLMDLVGQIYLEFIQPMTPVGETSELLNLTDVFVEDDLERWVGSMAEHFDYIVPGHTIAGVFNSERQTRWWFWYLNNVLGGEYDVKYGTGNKTPEYDYPGMAFDMADPIVEMALEEFGDWIVN